MFFCYEVSSVLPTFAPAMTNVPSSESSADPDHLVKKQKRFLEPGIFKLVFFF